MRYTHILSFAVQIGLSAVIYSNVLAETISDSANSKEELTCRQIIVNGVEKEQVYCGTEKQWAEYDRRAKLINAGVTCRWARTPRELCMNSEQWMKFDLRVRATPMGKVDGGWAERESTRMSSQIYNNIPH